MARSSVKIGIIMLLAWIIPLVGLLLAIVGLILGIQDRNGSRPDLARAGIFLNSLGLFLAILNITISSYLVFSGIIDPFELMNQLN